MRVYFTERDQMVVDQRRAPAPSGGGHHHLHRRGGPPFNRGYYSCDLTFFFEVEVEVYAGHGMPCSTVCGVGMFQKKVILYGSEGNVRVFSSEFRDNSCDPQDMPGRNAPRCTVQVADPVILSARLIEPCDRCSAIAAAAAAAATSRNASATGTAAGSATMRTTKSSS